MEFWIRAALLSSYLLPTANTSWVVISPQPDGHWNNSLLKSCLAEVSSILISLVVSLRMKESI